MTARLLLVDDDRAFRMSTAALLREEGHEVDEAESGAEATRALEGARYDLILLDLRMPGIDGIRLVEVLRTRGETTPVLMITGFGTVDSAVEALHSGADDFVTKPLEPEVLLDRVSALLERRPRPGEPGEAFGALVGRSEAMRTVFREMSKVAGTDATVLVMGETGTGKELVARALHEASARKDGPFVPVNCAALAPGVLESELFGHRKGAFTGAVSDEPGLFRAADGGTLFLDEIGDVPPEAQQRLLRAVQEREVTPVGGTRAVDVDVRLVAATNRDLRQAMEEGRFRKDLFFRLNVYRVTLPPLRERRSDIPLLAEHFLEREATGSSPLRLSPLAVRLLLRYPWPGNVRELQAAMESAAIRAEGRTIQAQDLPAEIRRESDDEAEGRYSQPGSDTNEKDAIVQALEAADGVRTRAAEILGMGRTTLWRKMKEYGLD